MHQNYGGRGGSRDGLQFPARRAVAPALRAPSGLGKGLSGADGRGGRRSRFDGRSGGGGGGWRRWCSSSLSSTAAPLSSSRCTSYPCLRRAEAGRARRPGNGAEAGPGRCAGARAARSGPGPGPGRGGTTAQRGRAVGKPATPAAPAPAPAPAHRPSPERPGGGPPWRGRGGRWGPGRADATSRLRSLWETATAVLVVAPGPWRPGAAWDVGVVLDRPGLGPGQPSAGDRAGPGARVSVPKRRPHGRLAPVLVLRLVSRPARVRVGPAPCIQSWSSPSAPSSLSLGY